MRRDRVRRLWVLFACLAAGIGIGAGGTLLAGDSAWFLAVPACLAVGWWFVADPRRCLGAGSSREARPERPSLRDGQR